MYSWWAIMGAFYGAMWLASRNGILAYWFLAAFLAFKVSLFVYRPPMLFPCFFFWSSFFNCSLSNGRNLRITCRRPLRTGCWWARSTLRTNHLRFSLSLSLSLFPSPRLLMETTVQDTGSVPSDL